jgi:hypothetical protein
MDFNLIDIAITVETRNATALMYLLMQSGRGYSEACRSTCCSWPLRTCAACSQNGDCTYFSLFGQVISKDLEAVRRHQKPPLPFAFSFFPDPENTLLACRLVVIGGAIHALDFLLAGFSELIGNVDTGLHATIKNITTRNSVGDTFALGNGPFIQHPEKLMVLSASDIAISRTLVHTSVAVRLLTPLRIVSDNRQVRNFQFGLFMRSIMRRVSAVSSYYGDADLTSDFKKLAQLSEKIHSNSEHFRFDSMPGGSLKLSGVIGEGCFSGDLSDMLPFLILASYLNAGKGASFGMGSFVVTLL